MVFGSNENKKNGFRNKLTSSFQELMFEDLQSVVDSNFNASLKTKVLVHGYTGGGAQSWVIRMKAGFLEKGKALERLLGWI